jgi:hypothetical protein
MALISVPCIHNGIAAIDPDILTINSPAQEKIIALVGKLVFLILLSVQTSAYRYAFRPVALAICNRFFQTEHKH